MLIAGGGGFIGGWLAADLLAKGHRVRCVDIKPTHDWFQLHRGAENIVIDLRIAAECAKAVKGVTQAYNLASDMGGMGFIEAHKAECMLSVLINTNLLAAARDARIERFFFASSACVYNIHKQQDADVSGLKEADAYPAMAEDGYGWEKLFSERMCRHFNEDFGLETRVARYHNVYGPRGAWVGGREKAPAAICRKVIEAKLAGRDWIEIWGDGEQTRSFLFIDDCVYGTQLIMSSQVRHPLNLGSSQLVTINEVVDIVERIAGIKFERRYNLDAPKGVRGRNSDNTLIKKTLAWEPAVPLRKGFEETYRWIYDQIVGTSPNNGITQTSRSEGSSSNTEADQRGFEEPLIARPARRSQVIE